ncbi:MAG TPA: CAP domain-containing protein [Solirubrobacterales bacterium]|nr:CAP domain-containing protein [Solirubrobacterales bacterium]
MPRSSKTLTAIAMVAAWMLINGSPASASSCPGANLQVSGLSQSAMESSIACLINEQRAGHGVRPVQPNAALRQAALGHSTEMISQRYFEHTSPAGVTFVDRIEAAGYTRGARSWEVGENLAWGSGSLSTPGSLVTSWMNSPPHRENLLRARFREIGIAAVVGTPESSRDARGVTVSSEYGYRSFAKAKKKRSKGKARKARRHRR